MALRKKLIELTNNRQDDEAIRLIHKASPLVVSLTDLLFLMRLSRASSNNQLGHLQLEAKMWVRENLKIIEKRIERREILSRRKLTARKG